MNISKNYGIYLAAFYFLLLSGCKDDQQIESFSQYIPSIVEARGYVVPQDSIEPPEIIPVAGVKSIPAGKPRVFPLPSNTITAPSSEIGYLPKPEVCTPGQDTFKLPEIISAIEKQIKAGLPEVVEVKQPQMVDFNSISFSSFNTLQGLPSNIIISIYQDKKGNVWIGTWGGGVAKYDGLSFTHYSTAQGLSGDVVRGILEDSNGNLWFGTNGGLNKFDGKHISVFITEQGLYEESIRNLFEDKNGNIWISTWNEVSKYDGKSFIKYSNEQGLRFFGGATIDDIDGNIWFRSNDGLSKYDGRSFFNYAQNINWRWNDLRASIQRDSFDGKSFLRYSSLIQNSAFNQFHIGQKGNIWFIGKGNLFKYNGKYIEKYRVPGVNMYSMLEDNSGNLWIGTNGNGILRSSGLLFSHITTEQGLSNKNIRSVLVDKNDNIWIGTFGGGVHKMDGNSISIYTKDQGLSSNQVTSICEDKNGNIWFGTWGGGLDKYDGKTFTNYNSSDVLPDNYISDLYADNKGNIWFGTQGGAGKFDGKSFTNFSIEQGLTGNNVFSILVDKNNNVWFGTRGSGLSKYDGKSFTHYSRKHGFSDETVHAMLEDARGNIWFGTAHGGVSKFDGKFFTHYTVDQGLSNNNVTSILEEKDGAMWFGTSDGLSKMSSAENQNAADISKSGYSLFKNYFYSDGFLGVGTWYNSLVQDNKGRIWAGASDRVTAFHPDEDIPDTITPNIQLSNVKLFNEEINWQNIEVNKDTSLVLSNGVVIKNVDFKGLTKWYYYPEKLALDYDNNSISFEFVGITTNRPKHVKYQYMLEGFDKNWNAVTSKPEAYYSNLSHGGYTFKVKAGNSDGYWSKDFLYSFEIRPPWWFTWWAYAFYGFCLVTGIFIVDRFQRKRLLDKAHAEAREKELKQAKEIEKAYEDLKSTQSQLIQSEKMASLGELTAGIAHEIQNPLNFVNNFSEVTKELAEELKEEAHKPNLDGSLISELAEDIVSNQTKIHHHGQRASGIVKGMLEHSRTSDGKKEHTDINALADEYLRLAYHGLRAKDNSFNADFKTVFDESLPTVNVIPQDIGRVLLNLINNAFYAVKEVENPLVTVTTKATPLLGGDGGGFKSLQITVSDNGSGIPEEIKDKIFQPFFTTKPTGSGTGLGLSLSYDIVKAHGGELKVDSRKYEGATFLVILPI